MLTSENNEMIIVFYLNSFYWDNFRQYFEKQFKNSIQIKSVRQQNIMFVYNRPCPLKTSAKAQVQPDNNFVICGKCFETFADVVNTYIDFRNDDR